MNRLDDIRRATELLQSVVNDRTLLLGLSDEERQQFLIAAGRASRPTRDEQKKLGRARRKKRRKDRYVADCEARAQTGIRAAREQQVYAAPARLEGGATASASGLRLEVPRNCYVCKAEYQELHLFYDSMCLPCAEFNYTKRYQSAPLTGRVALITGSRVKIGFQAALMLLRAGARVIVTTRFPNDAARRYTQEADYDDFASRLQIHGLDLRHAPSVELFTRYLLSSLDRLDFLINNAAQTVRRPPGFYNHLLAFESRQADDLDAKELRLLASHHACIAALVPSSTRLLEDPKAAALTHFGELDAKAPGVGLRSSAALSQIPYSFDDARMGQEVFPTGALDQDLQQVDLRKDNSWRLALADVPTPEMIEVQLVNSVAPFILCSKLKPLMLKSPNRDKHVVNVSAMEGQFSRLTKTDKHPHTNMAKAALNMMTRTSAADYHHDGIHMNSIDTGWVTDEDPAEIAARKVVEHRFHPPLDIVDGAARIVDPIMVGINTGEHVWGQFLKDYRPTDW